MWIVNPSPLASKVRILLSPPNIDKYRKIKIENRICGCRILVLPWPSKPMRRVRFSSPAPCGRGCAHLAQSVEHFLGKEEVGGSNPLVSSSKI